MRKMQLANVSMNATTMAVSPPYTRNAKKTIVSEKLIKNFERGSVRLIRGAMIIAKATIARNPMLKTPSGIVTRAKIKHDNPATMIANLY